MALRKALAYSKKHARPYTRVSRSKSKAYIKVVPHNKVVKYDSGERAMFLQGKMPLVIRLVSQEQVQIRDNALEAARQLLTKALDTNLPKQYYLELKVKPHHILRNNKTAAGAGADRLSTGMKHSFGIVEGRAAMVPAGKEVFIIACLNEAGIKKAREAMQMAKAKLPGSTKIVLANQQ